MATSNKNFKVKNGLDVTGAATASSFVKTGGTAAEFLMADGSVSAGGGGGSLEVSETPPSSPSEGDIWYNSQTGQTFVYYDSYWVENIAGVAGPQGPAGANGDTGDTGVVISESEPASTDVLWLDSDAVAEVPVPIGGTTGQVLAKSSSTDYDTEWTDTYTPTEVDNLLTPIENDIAALEAASIFPIKLNQQTITANYSIPVGYNGVSAGPITIDDGVTVTIPDGSSWSVV